MNSVIHRLSHSSIAKVWGVQACSSSRNIKGFLATILNSNITPHRSDPQQNSPESLPSGPYSHLPILHHPILNLNRRPRQRLAFHIPHIFPSHHLECSNLCSCLGSFSVLSHSVVIVASVPFWLFNSPVLTPENFHALWPPIAIFPLHLHRSVYALTELQLRLALIAPLHHSLLIRRFPAAITRSLSRPALVQP